MFESSVHRLIMAWPGYLWALIATARSDSRTMNGHHHHHGHNGWGTGRGKGRAAGARDTTCLEPLSMFLFLFSYFLSTKLLFTFRTTAMMTNGPATTSKHLNTLKWWQRQQQLSVHLTRGYAFSSRQCAKCLARTMWTQSLLSLWWGSWKCLSSSCFFC